MVSQAQPDAPGPATLCIAIAAKGELPLRPLLEAFSRAAAQHGAGVRLHVVHDRELDWPEQLRELDGLRLAPDSKPGAAIPVSTTRVPEETSILRFWGSALYEAREDYVAVLDAACPPDAGWLEEVQAQLRLGTKLFYGPVSHAWAPGDRRIIGYLVEYAQFMPPVRSGKEVPGNNIVLQRGLLGEAEALRNKGFFKTFLLWQLERERGLQAVYVEGMQVSYQKPFGLGAYLHRRWVHGRCFAACRFEQPGAPPRLACILFTPLLPWLRCLRIRSGLKQHAQLRKSFWQHSPLIWLAEACWSLGELLGYCFGDNGCCDRLD